MATNEKNLQPATNPFATASVVVPETAGAAAIVQRELGEVQAAVIMAKRYPRDPKAAYERIVTACGRLTLAQEALYQYARGGTDIEGPSIRLVEELARQWGNIACGVIEVDRRAGYSEALAFAWDLESNFRDEKRFQVKHWRDTKGGGYPIRDERDIYETLANQGARRKRACLLAVIPGDVADAAVEQCKQTLATSVAVTPERIASLVKMFGEYGVSKEALEKRLQRRVDTMSPAHMVQLSKIYNSLRDGMSVASDWFEMPPPAETPPETAVGIEGAKSALRKQRAQPPPNVDTESGEIFGSDDEPERE